MVLRVRTMTKCTLDVLENNICDACIRKYKKEIDDKLKEIFKISYT